MKDTSKLKQPSQRMLKVGEEVRHVLADVFLRGELHAQELENISITVSEVRMTPDLKLATAYIATLGNESAVKLLPILNKKYAHNIRRCLVGKLHLKFLPQVRFRVDESFDEANKINRLLYEANKQIEHE
jgi:ribosome-binding factor A